MDDATRAVMPPDPEMLHVGGAIWQRPQWRGLVQGAVQPGCVLVEQVLGQYPARVMLVDNQHPVEELAAQGPIIRSQTPFALGACGGLRRILMLSAVNTASKDSGSATC